MSKNARISSSFNSMYLLFGVLKTPELAVHM